MYRMFRFKSAFALMALCLLMGTGLAARVAAQDASTATSPIAGTWAMPPMGEDTGSIIALSSDGIVVDHETDGTSAVGAWEATGPETGVMTFVFFVAEPADEFTGSIIIRAELTYDAVTDTLAASYTVTGAAFDGTVVFASDAPFGATLTRFSAQGPEHAGEPIDGLTIPTAGTPTA